MSTATTTTDSSRQQKKEKLCKFQANGKSLAMNSGKLAAVANN